MARFHSNHPLSIFFVVVIIVSSLIAPSSSQFTNFIDCLNSNHVKNVTFGSYPHDDNASSLYYTLLNSSIQNLRFAQPSIPKPVAIVLPNTKHQLATTITCCRNQPTPLTITVRSGGHSYEGLSSVAYDTPFVIIDLMNLNRVAVDVGSSTAWVEAGATLGETYYAIAASSDSHGFSAGSCPTVGAGGHIAGGGFGLLSRKYGLAADNVIDAVLVDGQGRFLDRETMGEDVFWAIRGGGGGVWGAVYAWKIKLLQVPKIVTCFIVSRRGTNRQIAKLINRWQSVSPHLEDDFYLSLFVGAGMPEARGAGVSAKFNGFYLGPKQALLASLNRAFPELRLLGEECAEMGWIESIVFFSGLEKGSSVEQLKDRILHDKHFFKGKSDYVRAPISLRGINHLIATLEKEPKGSVIMDPYGGAMNRTASDALPFPHRSGNLYSIQYLISWSGEENERSEELMDWLRGFYRGMEPFVSAGPRAAYVNYLDLDLGVANSSVFPSRNAVEMARVWGEKYFLSNFDRLVRTKTAVDPDNVFRNSQSIPPLPQNSQDVAITSESARERERFCTTCAVPCLRERTLSCAVVLLKLLPIKLLDFLHNTLCNYA